MKTKLFAQAGATACAAALLVGALGVPAIADPSSAPGPQGTTLVGLGSDTIQDVLNGLAAASEGALASYDASINTATVTPRDGSAVTIPRANGSSAGRDLLRVAIGQTGSASIPLPVGVGGSTSVTTATTAGYIDFARSSSAGSAPVSGGVLAFVPFAKDTVSVAVGPTSPLAVVPWQKGTGSEALSAPTLWNVYRGDVKYAYISGAGTEGSPYAYHSVGATDTAPGGTTAYEIQALLPQVGSGTRSFFAGQIGLANEGAITAVNTSKPGTILWDGVQEHDGSALELDDTAVVPFSIAQWVAQSRGLDGVNDRRHGAQILGLDGQAAVVYDDEQEEYSTSPAYTVITRNVFNIVPSRWLDDPANLAHEVFAGQSSFVCQQTAVIQAYGFQLLPNGSGPGTCGFTGDRHYAASPSTATVSFDTTAPAVGDTVTATVSATSNGNRGGVIQILQGSTVLGAGEIEAGQTAGEIEFAVETAGTTSLVARFIPTLPGIASDDTDPTEIVVAATETAVELSAPSTFRIGSTVNLVAWITPVDAAGGKVEFWQQEVFDLPGSSKSRKPFKTATLQPGEQAAFATLAITRPATSSYSLLAVYTPVDTVNVAGSQVTRTVAPAGALPSIAVSKPSSVKFNTAAKATVTLKNLLKKKVGSSGKTPSGQVQLRYQLLEGSTPVGDAFVTGLVNLKSGKASISLPKSLAKGKYQLTLVYLGDAYYAAAEKSAGTLTVK